jgi:hypothetical protein
MKNRDIRLCVGVVWVVGRQAAGQIICLMVMNMMQEYQHLYHTNYSSKWESNSCDRNIVCTLNTKAGVVVKGEVSLLYLVML